jgi:hypothetical protein
MINQSRTLLENITVETGNSQTGFFYAYGDKKIGAGYYRNGDGIHTIHYTVNSFVGEIIVQGTLEQYPSNADADWVDVITFAGDSTLYNQFPNPIETDSYDDSKTFTGKFVWIRVKYKLENGTIREIRYNY